MSLTHLLGIAAGVIMIKKTLEVYPSLVGVKLDKVLNFIEFMAVVTIIRVMILQLSGYTPPLVEELKDRSVLSFINVWWEDALFVLPILFIERKFALKPIWVKLLVFASSLLFASGHVYQGFGGFIFGLAYINLVSYPYGKKHGLGTVMVCHILYDMATFITMKASQ